MNSEQVLNKLRGNAAEFKGAVKSIADDRLIMHDELLITLDQPLINRDEREISED